jgi:serine/threonine-protein kinase
MKLNHFSVKAGWVVFHARDTVLQRDVALKVLPERFANDAEWFARFQREAQVLASLDRLSVE